MRKTICDRCGTDCAGRIGRLILVVEDRTANDKQVGETQFEPIDLDGICIDFVREMFGFKVAYEHHMSDGEDGPERPLAVMERVEIGMTTHRLPDIDRDHP